MKKPCNVCTRLRCPEEGCKDWEAWFLERWADIQAAAWDAVDQSWRHQIDHFTYEVPHLRRSPCCGCPCESWCQRACSGKRSWDRRAYAKR